MILIIWTQCLVLFIHYLMQKKLWVTFIFSSFVLIGLTSFVIFWVMRKYISSPLAQVSDILDKIRAGEERQILPLKNNANDELGLLRLNINSLLTELEEKFNQE